MDEQPQDLFLEFKISGCDDAQWTESRRPLLEAMRKITEKIARQREPASAFLLKEAEELAHGLKGHVKAKIDRPELENALLRAEVLKKYAEMEAIQANARKVSAEADMLELANDLKRLQATMAFFKAANGDDIVTVAKIDAFTDCLKLDGPKG